MVIRLACPHCHAPLKARDDQVGKLVRCSKCKRPLVVPLGPDVPSDWSTRPSDAEMNETHLTETPPPPPLLSDD